MPICLFILTDIMCYIYKSNYFFHRGHCVSRTKLVFPNSSSRSTLCLPWCKRNRHLLAGTSHCHQAVPWPSSWIVAASVLTPVPTGPPAFCPSDPTRNAFSACESLSFLFPQVLLCSQQTNQSPRALPLTHCKKALLRTMSLGGPWTCDASNHNLPNNLVIERKEWYQLKPTCSAPLKDEPMDISFLPNKKHV